MKIVPASAYFFSRVVNETDASKRGQVDCVPEKDSLAKRRWKQVSAVPFIKRYNNI
jgi:hypothetical protein